MSFLQAQAHYGKKTGLKYGHILLHGCGLYMGRFDTESVHSKQSFSPLCQGCMVLKRDVNVCALQVFEHTNFWSPHWA